MVTKKAKKSVRKVRPLPKQSDLRDRKGKASSGSFGRGVLKFLIVVIAVFFLLSVAYVVKDKFPVTPDDTDTNDTQYDQNLSDTDLVSDGDGQDILTDDDFDVSLNLSSIDFGSTDYDENETDEPGSITNLNAVRDADSITWAWDNPDDSDFNMNIIYFRGINVKNTSDSFFEAEDLQQNTDYRIKIFTMDTYGNINDTEVADTVRTCISVCSYGQCDTYCPEDN